MIMDMAETLRKSFGNSSNSGNPLEDMIKNTRRGVLVTRLWYIRTLDPQTLLYTGLTRDGTFYIENGEIKYPIKNFRFNESPIVMLNNIEGLGKKVIDQFYDLKFISLNSYSTIRTVVDDTLSKNGIDVTRLKVEMELNSIEAIKNAVQSSLGAAFVSVSAITKELELNLLNCVRIEDVKINRKLCIILNPNRYKSKASENFTKEILTLLK